MISWGGGGGVENGQFGKCCGAGYAQALWSGCDEGTTILWVRYQVHQPALLQSGYFSFKYFILNSSVFVNHDNITILFLDCSLLITC